MKKFFQKAFILVFCVSISMFAAIFLPSKSPIQYLLYSQIDKNDLLKKTTSPRIIFVGGSNLPYGLDSKQIKDSLHCNPINAGVHASIGLKYMLANTQQYVKSGDVVVLSAEYQQFYGNLADGEGELLSIVTDIVPQSRELLDYKQYFSLIQLLPEYAQSKLRPIVLFYKYPKNTEVGRYDRAAFNTFGDATAHWVLSAENPKPYPAITESFNEDALQALINFRNTINKKKAKLYVTFPGYQYSSYKNSFKSIKQVEQKLKASSFALISTPEEYVIPDSMIFDTPYHLTKKGVDYRTRLLIKDLKVLKRK